MGSEGTGNKRLGRLKGLGRRKRARRGFECEVIVHKMRLVKIKGVGGR